MNGNLTFDALIKKATELEKESIEFYMIAASVTKNSTGQKMFRDLSQQAIDNVITLFATYGLEGISDIESFLLGENQKSHILEEQVRLLVDSRTNDQQAMKIALSRDIRRMKIYSKALQNCMDPRCRRILEDLQKKVEKQAAEIQADFNLLLGPLQDSKPIIGYPDL
jgi:rubrerythrin